MTQIIAHRGASNVERENTVAAFERAVAVGADMIEFDVRVTADGVLVVHHDARLDDTTAISSVTVDRLPGWVPTFEQALAACDGVAVNVEIKHEPDDDPDRADGHVERVMDALAAFDRASGGIPRRWLVSSFRFATVLRARQLYPGVRAAFLTEQARHDDIERTASAGLDAFNPDDRRIDATAIRYAHRLGLSVNVWTVNQPARIAELIGWGVDGIFTDVPEVALTVRETPA